MLQRLQIDNYALIDHLDIELGRGLTVITGETGAGKSILLGALSLILGERAETKTMRDKEKKIIVEATFDIQGYGLEEAFAAADLDYDERECILRREVLPAGRSRAFINDTPVPLAVMREIATRLVDIHSQHNNMLLARPQYQLEVLDNLSGDRDLIERYAKVYEDFRQAERQWSELKSQLEKSKTEEDYLRFQLDQLNELRLQPDEDRNLEAELAKLSNMTEIKQALWQVSASLNGEQESILHGLREVAAHLRHVAPSMGEFSELTERVESVIIELKDIADTVDQTQDGLVDDPARLEQVEQRLQAIFDLERKHNADSSNRLLEIQSDFEQRLSAIDHGDERLEQLHAKQESLRADAKRLADMLTVRRQETAADFASQLEHLAKRLGLTNLRFKANVSPTDLGPKGQDHVEFTVAFNKNQPLMQVKETASGGEISRLMLCIKAIIAGHMQLPTIIFDEIDTGVSGDIASMVGETMSSISKSIQVLAITHLPQVAAHGAAHLRVYKSDTLFETVTRVSNLTGEQHVMEIARLLSGRELDKAAIENAKSLIKECRNYEQRQ